MIRFLVARGYEFTLDALIKGRLGSPAPSCRVLTYDRFLARPHAPAGVYIFCDLERLTPWELRLAAEAFGVISQDSRCRALNDPARVLGRYELLRSLRLDGINDFDVLRADECRAPSLYPVFLRFEHDHGRPLSDLLHSREELDQALRRMREQHIPARGVLIVEYAAEPFAPGMFRKFSSFRVGNAVFAHHVVVEDNWVVKHGLQEMAPSSQREHALHEGTFVTENWHADLLRRVFEIAGIEYGRADFGIVGGRVQVYEVNTNPYLSLEPLHPSEDRQATLALSARKLLDGFAVLDDGRSDGSVKLHGPLLDHWRAGRKWYERPEKRP